MGGQAGGRVEGKGASDLGSPRQGCAVSSQAGLPRAWTWDWAGRAHALAGYLFCRCLLQPLNASHHPLLVQVLALGGGGHSGGVRSLGDVDLWYMDSAEAEDEGACGERAEGRLGQQVGLEAEVDRKWDWVGEGVGRRGTGSEETGPGGKRAGRGNG